MRLVNPVDCTIATSPENAEVMARSFDIQRRDVLEVGSARTDRLVATAKTARETPPDRLTILLAPTFRAYNLHFDYFNAYGMSVAELEDYCQRHGLNIVLRFHPVVREANAAILRSQLSSMGAIRIDAIDDTIDSMLQADIVITDISSVALDFLVTGRPVLFVDFAMTEYVTRERELVFDPSSLPQALRARTWPEILNKVDKLRHGRAWREYWSAYDLLRNRLQAHSIDGRAAQRLHAALGSRLVRAAKEPQPAHD
jgi:CDP-glycerol glycerophosphotransferase